MLLTILKAFFFFTCVCVSMTNCRTPVFRGLIMNLFTTVLIFLYTSLANLLFCLGKEVWVRYLIEAMLKLDHVMFCN